MPGLLRDITHLRNRSMTKIFEDHMNADINRRKNPPCFCIVLIQGAQIYCIQTIMKDCPGILQSALPATKYASDSNMHKTGEQPWCFVQMPGQEGETAI